MAKKKQTGISSHKRHILAKEKSKERKKRPRIRIPTGRKMEKMSPKKGVRIKRRPT